MYMCMSIQISIGNHTRTCKSRENHRHTKLNYGEISSFKVYPLVDLAKKPIFTRKHPLVYTVLSIIDVKHDPQNIFIVDTTKYI